ncbi:LolA-like protein [Algoriphagus namhaensis]
MKKTVFSGLLMAFGLISSSFASKLTENPVLNDPQTIIANYIEAVGGLDNVNKIKNSVMVMEAEFQGAALVIRGISDQENSRLLQETSFMGNVAQKTVMVGGKGKMMAMGQEQEIPAEMIELLKAQTFVFPELHYEELGYTLEAQGTEEIEGEMANKLVISAPNGMQTTEYYSVESGLKIRTSSAASGDITYRNYTEVDGVKVPMQLSIKNPMLPTALETTVTSVKFNQELTDEDFK